jgi:hypothetical protein
MLWYHPACVFSLAFSEDSRSKCKICSDKITTGQVKLYAGDQETHTTSTKFHYSCFWDHAIPSFCGTYIHKLLRDAKNALDIQGPQASKPITSSKSKKASSSSNLDQPGKKRKVVSSLSFSSSSSSSSTGQDTTVTHLPFFTSAALMGLENLHSMNAYHNAANRFPSNLPMSHNTVENMNNSGQSHNNQNGQLLFTDNRNANMNVNVNVNMNNKTASPRIEEVKYHQKNALKQFATIPSDMKGIVVTTVNPTEVSVSSSINQDKQ